MFRSIRRFRTLAATLPNAAAANAAANREHQLKLIKELDEIEEAINEGGSDKAKKLHKSRDKLFGTYYGCFCLTNLPKRAKNKD